MTLCQMAKDKEKDERYKGKKSRNNRPKYGIECTACMRKMKIMKDGFCLEDRKSI